MSALTVKKSSVRSRVKSTISTPVSTPKKATLTSTDTLNVLSSELKTSKSSVNPAIESKVKAKTVLEHIVKSKPVEAQFCKDLMLTPLHFQTKGVAFDAEDAQGFRYEFKHDIMGESTGNHYLEIAQTNDGGVTWVDSGFSLSLYQAKFYVIRIGQNYQIFNVLDLDLWIESNHSKCKAIQTRPGANGNRPGQFSKGFLIKFVDLARVPNMRLLECK